MKKNSLMNSLFGILPPLFFDKPSAGGIREERGDANGEDSQLTGVARYLQKLEPKVEEVIEEQLTGVAKYLAQQKALEEANKPVIEELEPEALEEEVQEAQKMDNVR